MRNQDCRNEFQQLLMCTIIPEGIATDVIQQQMRPIVDYINAYIPTQLFRFRACNELNFDAFDRDAIYAVTPDLFNDPYDALFKYDSENIVQEYRKGMQLDSGKALLQDIIGPDTMSEFLIQTCGEDRAKIFKKMLIEKKDDINQIAETAFAQFNPHREEYLSNIESLLTQSTQSLKRSAAVACFSEIIDSVLMWSHYADYHKGFALEYDLRHFELKCGNCEKRDSCEMMILGNIYPVIYSSERYDATQYAINFAANKKAMKTGGYFREPDMTVGLKAFLHKSTQWEYEKEWRLILNRVDCDYSKPIDIALPPLAIYYGNNISSINRKILHSIAIGKGLREYQMYIDESSNEYIMKFRQCKE